MGLTFLGGVRGNSIYPRVIGISEVLATVKAASKISEHDRNGVLAARAHADKERAFRAEHRQKEGADRDKKKAFHLLASGDLGEGTARADEAREEKWKD